MPDFKEILNRITEFFKKLNATQKIIMVGSVVAVIAAIIFISGFSTKTTYNMLFQSPLSPEEYAKVTEKLQEMGVDFETKDDKYILVKDENTGREIRMKLGWEGLIPESVRGWELFDVQSFTTTDFERNVNLRRAIIGEMQKHLTTLDDIDTVSIQVSFPQEQQLYTEYAAPLTASVVVTPAPYSDLAENKEKIKAIVNLVSAGIPDLKPENVVVVDDKGNVLSDLLVPNDLSDSMKLAHEQLRIQERERALLISRIQKSLESAVDPSRLVVEASIQFDWTKSKVNSELIVPTTVRPDNPLTPYDDSEVQVTVPVSERQTTENFQGPAYIPEGPPGTEPNVPPGLQSVIDRFTHYQRDDNIVNYDSGRQTVEEEKAPYEIKKISVAVAIDGIWTIERNDVGDPIVTNGGRIARSYTPVSDDDLKRFKDWVKAAVGFQIARGDEVAVITVPFDHNKEFEAEDEKIRRKVQLRRTLIASIIVLFFLFIGTLVYRAIAREMERRRRLREEELARQQQAMREAALRAAEEEAATVELSIEEKARMELLENAINISRERPDDVARLIRTWLAEE